VPSVSPWMVADAAARQLAEVAGKFEPGSDEHAFARVLADLAVVVRDCAERVGLRAEGVTHPLEVGKTYTLTVEVQATVRDNCTDGSAYELELERRNFMSGRTVSVDADEIVGASDER
jgi:hypothetical protein